MAAETEANSPNQRWKKGSNLKTIKSIIETGVPNHSINSRRWTWKQFEQFCRQQNYNLSDKQPREELNKYLANWALNMKKADGEEYKDHTVRTIWSVSAKILQLYYLHEFREHINPFKSVEFEGARKARDKRCEQLHQKQNVKRKALAPQVPIRCKSGKMESVKWDENTPEGLQKKLFHVFSQILDWSMSEATTARIDYFHEETDIDNDGNATERIEYNPTFSKSIQDSSLHTNVSKWLVMNTKDPDMCPIRLFRLLVDTRQYKTNLHLFLEVNPNWETGSRTGWYKETPLGEEELLQWKSETEVARKSSASEKPPSSKVNFIRIAPSPGPRASKLVVIKPLAAPVQILPDSTDITSSRSLPGVKIISSASLCDNKPKDFVTPEREKRNTIARLLKLGTAELMKSTLTDLGLREGKTANLGGENNSEAELKASVRREGGTESRQHLKIDKEIRTDSGVTLSGVNGYETRDGVHVTYNNCTFHIHLRNPVE